MKGAKLRTNRRVQILFPFEGPKIQYAPAGSRIERVYQVDKEYDGDRLLVSIEGFKGRTWMRAEYLEEE